MIRLFDYIFYRIYNFFREKDNFIPETKASGTLSLLQFFTILDVLVLIRIVYPFPLPDNIYFLPVILGLGFMNWNRYERGFDIEELVKSWSGEEISRRRKNGWLIVMYMIVSVLVIAIYGAATN